jgi:glycosyltransferase involved in cell wall biosynthesis
MTSEKYHAPELVIVGAFPPPVHGMALVTEAVRHLVSEHRRAVVFDVSPTEIYGPFPSLGVAVKLARHVGVWARLPWFRLHGAKVLYMPLDSSWGLMFNLITLLVGRSLGMRFVLHHHVALYVIAPSRAMRWVNALTGPQDLQIFTCRNMLERFQTRYPPRAPMRHISNSAFFDIDVAAAPASRERTTLVIGMLAGLTMEKGLGVMLDLLDAIAREGLDIRMVVAGPAHQAEARDRLEAAVATHPDRLDYRGPVLGEDKERFYQDIDLFVFPTLYRLETEPLVVIEALSHERPVVAYARGCIGEVVGDRGGVIITDDEDFVARTLTVCRSYLADPAALAAAQRRAGERAGERAAEARDGSRQLLAALAAAPAV